MALRQAWYFFDSTTNDGSDYFLIPSDCYCVWVTMIGGGANGKGLGDASGKDGGSSCWPIIRYPLAVTPNGVLCIVVGRGGLASVGGTGVETDQPNSVMLSSVITGDIVDPICWSMNPVFSSGYAGSTSNTMVMDCQNAAPLNIGVNAAVTFNTAGNSIPGIHGRAVTRETGGSSASRIGMCVGNDKGLGSVGTGGAGGGNTFGIGGAGGTTGVGGNGSGYGSGGGGGCNSAYGGDGAPGFVLLEY